MSVATIKAAMVSLLANGDNWGTKYGAVDEDGKPCPPLSTRAVKWDLSGALMKASAGEPNFSARNEILSTLTAAIPGSFKSKDLDAWNDSAEWTDVFDMIDSL